MDEPTTARKLTDDDIKAIVAALETSNHRCRFQTIEEEDLREAVDFYKNFNRACKETSSTIRRTMVVLGITGVITLISMGLVAKFKEITGP